MAKSYRDGATRTTGQVAWTRTENGLQQTSSLRPLPVNLGRVVGGTLVRLPDSDDSLGRVGQLDFRLIRHDVENTLSERLVEGPAPPRIREKAHRQADPVVQHRGIHGRRHRGV